MSADRPPDDRETGRARPAGGPADQDVSSDFVFGTLATDALRIAQLKAASTGVRHALELQPRDPEPGEAVTLTATVGPGIRADHVTAYYTTDGQVPEGDRGRPVVGSVCELRRVGVRWDTLLWAYVETWTGVIPPQPDGTLVQYRIQAWSEAGAGDRWAVETAGVVGGARPAGMSEDDALVLGAGEPPLWPVSRRGAFAFHVDEARIPGWLREAVIYEVFVDRFAADGGRRFATPDSRAGFYGGTLAGITEHLDYIDELGVSCLWLTPVFPSPSHHGYDTTDYTTIEPRLGTEDDLRRLVDEAHRRGIRVILDLALNHVSSTHPAFVTATANRDSPEAGWFTFIDWPDRYLSYFGLRDLPQVDGDSPAARRHLVDAARRWLDLGVDGFRCDHANGPSHAFWSVFRRATRDARADSITIGEVAETPALQRTYAGRLDGCLDFTLLQALRRLFAFGEITVSEFESFLRRHLEFFGEDLALPSFLDNHDMNRFLWAVRGDVRRLRLAALCQFTLPGPPIVYYGTEVGLSQQRDVRSPDGSGHPEEARLPMPWGEAQDRDLLAFYRRLGALRRASRVWQGTRRTIALDDDAGLLAYGYDRDAESAIVVLNTGAAAAGFRPGSEARWRVALATDDGVRLEGGELRLPPLGGSVLLPDRA